MKILFRANFKKEKKRRGEKKNELKRLFVCDTLQIGFGIPRNNGILLGDKYYGYTSLFISTRFSGDTSDVSCAIN